MTLPDTGIGAEVERKLQSLQRWIIGGLLAMLVLGLLTLGFVAWTAAGQVRSQQALIASQQELIREGEEAHDALVALKRDVQVRRARLAKYLRDNPGPEPIPGIPRPLLQQSLDNYDATLEALQNVKP